MSGIVQNKAIFIHVPKTGGTAIRHSLGVKSGHHKYNYFEINLPSFMFVREPIDRFISAYNYLKYNENMNKHDLLVRNEVVKYKDINEFIESDCYHDFLHFKRQVEWNTPSMIIGKFENLNEYFESICKVLNLNFLPLKHEKKTVKKDTTVITDENMQRLFSFYQEDYETFNYKKL